MGRNKEAVADARLAVKSQPESVAAKDTLGKALYSAGQFEKALAEFHKAHRMRPISVYEEWIARCEETIKSFLTATKIDFDIIKTDIDTGIMTKEPIETHEKKKAKDRKERNERRKTGLLMGKLHADMTFLDKIANHPDLQKNLLVVGEDKKNQKDIDNVLKEIRGAALDGLGFLQVRKTFWETSEPPQ